MFFLGAHGMYTNIEGILGHKTNLNKFKRSAITEFGHSGINLVINNIKIKRLSTNTYKLNNMFLNNSWVRAVPKKINKYIELNKMKIQQIKA